MGKIRGSVEIEKCNIKKRNVEERPLLKLLLLACSHLGQGICETARVTVVTGARGITKLVGCPMTL